MDKELKDIIEKVGNIYHRYGIKSVTMDDVAHELGISKKTLYQYVDNKTDLVTKVIEHQIESTNCQMNNLKEKSLNAIEELLEVNNHLLRMRAEINLSAEYDLRKYYPDLYEKIKKNQRVKMLQSILDNMIKGKKEGLYRKDLKEDIIARLQVSRFETLADSDIFTMEEFLSDDFINELFIYHIRGIANDKGIAFLEEKLKNKQRTNENDKN